MKELFDKRRQAFWQEMVSYLSYVFNDHFVLVLMVGLGMVLYYYRQLLLDLPDQRGWLYLGFLILSVFLLSLGRQASYLLAADAHYLLAKEAAVSAELTKAYWRSLLVWGLVQSGVLSLVYPLWSALGHGWLSFLLGLLCLFGLRTLWQAYRFRQLVGRSGLDWQRAIRREERRQGSLRRFFSLFTQVKGLTTSVKKRPYLNPLLARVVGLKDGLWLNLYWRAFLRAGDYLGLYSRLAVLALLALRFVGQPLLAGAMAVLCHFLLSFQLLPLYHHYEHQLPLRLAPVVPGAKAKAFHRFFRQLNYGLLVVEALVSLRVGTILVLVFGTILVVEVYLAYKLKAIDEVA